MIKTCVVIGSGNVATHLAGALAGYVEIRQIYSRNLSHAEELASVISAVCCATDDTDRIYDDADLYMMAVTDDSIKELAQRIKSREEAIWVHTSGSVDMEVFEGLKKRYGVFYPLQTFSKGKPVDMREVPIFIEACSSEVENELMALASEVTDKVSALTSDGRRRLHIAAVFACNFVNYMWTVADRQLQLCGTDIHALDPLLKETFEKIATMSPKDAQTGPARRGDTKVIGRHIEMLDRPDAQLYKLISSQIYHTYMSKIDYNLKKIKAFVFDVDGVLSPSTVPMTEEGLPARMVNVKDGYAMQLAVKHGYKIAIISGGKGKSLELRYKALGINDVYTGVSMKLPVLEQWMADNQLDRSEVVFVGDDIPDYECMKAVGLSVAPADADVVIKSVARYISTVAGGYGVAREIIEEVMKTNGDWLSTEKAFGW